MCSAVNFETFLRFSQGLIADGLCRFRTGSCGSRLLKLPTEGGRQRKFIFMIFILNIILIPFKVCELGVTFVFVKMTTVIFENFGNYVPV